MNDTPPTSPGRDDSPSAPVPKRGRSLAFQLAALGLTVVSALAGTGLARWLRTPPMASTSTTVTFPNRLFLDWKKKPDFVLVLSAQQNGYLLPCGCSSPQVGGLERRYNFLQIVKAAGWPYVAADLGNIPQRHAPADIPNLQAMLKYDFSMQALKTMNYSAVGIGENEANLGLLDALAQYSLNNEQPRVVAGNLMDAEKQFLNLPVPWTLAKPAGAGVSVGLTSVVGPNIATKIKKLTESGTAVRFERTPDAINRILADMKAKKVDLPVLLYQGPMTRNAGQKPYTEAMAAAEAYPEFPIVVCLSEEDEPPTRAVELKTKSGTTSLLISLGRKGKFVGVVGVWKTGNAANPYELKYERAEMTEDFKTGEGQDKDHPVVKLMEQYTRRLKDENYLEKYAQLKHALQVMPAVPDLDKPGEATYVGSDKCKTCHKKAYKIWEKTPHSHAWQTLVDAKHPSNRQHDPECIVCHVVGFGYKGGFVNETKTEHLKNVGCESCHGPSSMHVANPNNVDWQKRVNPWKYLPAEKREAAIDQFCQKCHDIDNDVTWIGGGFKRKWPKVAHPESE